MLKVLSARVLAGVIFEMQDLKILSKYSEMPTSTDYPYSLRKVVKIFSFLRTTENPNFSTGIKK